MSVATKPPPKDWPRMSASVFYSEAAKAIDWLCNAFGFEVQLRVEGEAGRIEHAELVLAGALITTGDVPRKDREWRRTPKEAGGCTISLCFYIDDVDAHCERARKAGAVIAQEPKTTDYGDDYWVDRSYGCFDPEGHHWWFMQRIKDNPRKS
ncbi:MAG TPA: VOC family protein [Kofleriaceae bacterium]|nr:VOC family protein [Kofleriaceae bacterium]